MQEADRAAVAIKSATQHLADALANREPPKPLEAEPPKESDPPPQSKMFFDRPEQLLQILANLEEQNLFLIQNAQEFEEARDELEATFKYVLATIRTDRYAASLQRPCSTEHCFLYQA